MLETTIAAIRPADEAAMAAARELHGRLTKPAGSLGALEDLSVRLAGLAGACPPPLPEPAARGDLRRRPRGARPGGQPVAAGGHRADDRQLPGRRGGGQRVRPAGRRLGHRCRRRCGHPLPDRPDLARPTRRSMLDPALPDWFASVRRGTRDFTVTAALTRDEALAAVQTGIRIADELIDAGAGILLTGDMGIGNTTPAAALIAAFTGADPLDATGRGTGIDDPTYAHKVAVVRVRAGPALARPGRPAGCARRRRWPGARRAGRADPGCRGPPYAGAAGRRDRGLGRARRRRVRPGRRSVPWSPVTVRPSRAPLWHCDTSASTR